MAIFHFNKIFKLENLSTSEKIVLLALADHANAEGGCFPSIRRLAKWASMTPRGVQKVLRRLELAGLVKTVTNGGKSGLNSYNLHFPADEPLASSKLAAPRPVVNAWRGAPSLRRSAVSPKSSIVTTAPHVGTSRKAKEPASDTSEQTERAQINVEEAELEFYRLYARKFEDGDYVPAFIFKPRQAREMLRLNFATESQLRKAGIQF